MLGHRFVAFFARAGAISTGRRAPRRRRRRPYGQARGEQAGSHYEGLLALTGYGTAHLTDRMLSAPNSLLHYAGLFAMRPRSARTARARWCRDFLGMRVEVMEFAGAWLSLPPDQRTRIGANGSINQLGVDAAAGCEPGTRGADPAAHRSAQIATGSIGCCRTAGAASAGRAGAGVRRVRDRVRGQSVLGRTAFRRCGWTHWPMPATRLGWNTWMELPGRPTAALTPPSRCSRRKS